MAKRKLLNYCPNCHERTEQIKIKIYSSPSGRYLGTQWICNECKNITKDNTKK